MLVNTPQHSGLFMDISVGLFSACDLLYSLLAFGLHGVCYHGFIFECSN